ncbi:hypothetical protein N5J77_28755 [Sphingobium yanoikuyae]|uniref:Uncharacterized protein n=1 Tax=Sphingobium yanoikuyae TaxID=13690 RepID=A0AA42X3L0_SPHYA|nr:MULTISPECIES: hypothetical protein [Sphingobium]MDH2135122.1 hypothetical protein [Sphingobium yanoikuyae]MDH2153119.1 hypothetical protein [Sphingobium yanoikuyae]MDH2170481.1 hypothetical protein [Sphingobium yanoikuyae]
MREFIALLFMLAFFAGAWGIIKPYKGLSRKKFVLITICCFIAIGIIAPSPTPEQQAKRDAEAKAAQIAEVEAGQNEILAKAKAGMESVTKYTKDDFEDTYAKVGAGAFKRLNELEPGAIYAAAESKNCDAVSVGAVSLKMSRKDKPMWFVDCSNGNRFMIDTAQAEAAMQRFKDKKLVATDLEQSCTDKTVSMCSASKAQKSAKEVEVVTFCDMTVQKALVGDSSMDWGWDYGFGDDDTIRVARDFKAENAFGAKLKHRYFCDFNAATQRIEKLVIEGPFGSQKII